MQHKLPANPILVLTPSGPVNFWKSGTARSRHWKSMLTQLGKLEIVEILEQGFGDVEDMELEPLTPVGQYLQQMIGVVTSRVREASY